MISRYAPLVNGIFGGGTPAAAPMPTFFPTKSAGDLEVERRNAQEEAQRKQQQDAQSRAGAESTLLTSPDLGSTFGQAKTQRATLLGSG